MTAAATPPPTVLLVDDDPTIRFLLRRLLHQHWPRLSVLEAADGTQGLALVGAHCHAGSTPCSLLVVLDLHMPGMNGLEFLAHYQHLPQYCHHATTVVICSSSIDPYEQALARVWAAEWLPKPLHTEHLAYLLRQYLPAALRA